MNVLDNFLIGGERVVVGQTSLLSSLGRAKLTNSLAEQQLDFGITRDQAVHLETAGNLCTSLPDVKKPFIVR